jgi:hypothetical protein
MPLQATSGAASYDAFGGGAGASVVPNYIEDVFSTWLYTGNGSTGQSIINNIDLATKGGLVWIKTRNDATNHALFDTTRGVNKRLQSNTTNAEAETDGTVTAFNANGFSVGYNYDVNGSSNPQASWTFRKQPKFFDIVTYTGDGTFRTVAHNLGSVPGMIIVKRLDTTADWVCYQRSLDPTVPEQKYIYLNRTDAVLNSFSIWNSTAPTASVFSLGGDVRANASGGTYVAYLFAHNAGGFGLTGSDNVISCGSFTTDGSSNYSVTLGYEPQWVLWKRVNTTGNWQIYDNMRGMGVAGTSFVLYTDVSNAEGGPNSNTAINSTGFTGTIGSASQTYIYIAIRRGPMKVPTLGTSVFSPNAASSGTQTTGFPVDMQILSYRSGTDSFLNHQVIDRLRGVSSTSTPLGNYLNTTSTAAESNDTAFSSTLMSNVGFQVPANYAGASSVFHSFRRAPSFFDEVCVTTSGYEVTATHNLGVSPELIIGKARNQTGSWVVWASAVAALNVNNTLILNTTAAATNNGMPINTVTATSFYAAIAGVSVETEVFYLFATCAGVSKVFSYTGNGSSQTINCGFTGGARFVMIKRTDSTGDWYVWDTARGIVSGNDPHLSLNSTAAEVTSNDTIDTDSTGFVVNQVSASNVNVSSATYIGLAIA